MSFHGLHDDPRRKLRIHGWDHRRAERRLRVARGGRPPYRRPASSTPTTNIMSSQSNSPPPLLLGAVTASVALTAPADVAAPSICCAPFACSWRRLQSASVPASPISVARQNCRARAWLNRKIQVYIDGPYRTLTNACLRVSLMMLAELKVNTTTTQDLSDVVIYLQCLAK